MNRSEVFYRNCFFEDVSCILSQFQSELITEARNGFFVSQKRGFLQVIIAPPRRYEPSYIVGVFYITPEQSTKFVSEIVKNQPNFEQVLRTYDLASEAVCFVESHPFSDVRIIRDVSMFN